MTKRTRMNVYFDPDLLAQVEVRSREQRPGSYLGHTPRLRPLNHEVDLSVSVPAA